jgi:glycosyltransferase involved in cell wall biosynthesis
LNLVSPSRWLAQCVHESRLFQKAKISIIPNGIDLKIYYPRKVETVRSELKLPAQQKLILFGAMSLSEKRKGFDLLKASLSMIKNNNTAEMPALLVFGEVTDEIKNLGFQTYSMGYVDDESKLAKLYSAANVFIAPSRQDNLPNTVMEALACGTPVVAFDIGGMPDMIEHQKNGYLAKPYDTQDLAVGIDWILSDSERWNNLSERARKKAEQEFDIKLIAQKYLDLYENILNEQKSS